MTDNERCRGCREKVSLHTLWAMYEDSRLQDTIDRYPNLFPPDPKNKRRIMISTTDGWGEESPWSRWNLDNE